jgi:membrane protein
MNSGVPHRRLKIIWNIKDIVTQAVRAWVEHGTSTMGAALAFYTVFSVAPILIIAIGILGLAVGADTVRAQLLPQMQVLFGNAGASAIQTLLSSANFLGNSRMATAVGSITLILGASSVFIELQNSLDRIWGIPKRVRVRGVWRIVRSRFLSLDWFSELASSSWFRFWGARCLPP